MKVYIVLVTIGVEEEDILDRVYSHPDDAATRVNAILWQAGQLGRWRLTADRRPTADEERAWAAERDIEDLIPWLGGVRSASVEEREVLEPPTQYVEYCQLDYKIDCRKPNLGGPESHMRTFADINSVDIADGRVKWKSRTA